MCICKYVYIYWYCRGGVQVVYICMYGGFQKMGYHNSWMVYLMENPNLKWLIWGYLHFGKPPYLQHCAPPVISWFTKNVRIEKYRYIYHKPLLELCSPTERFRTGAPPCLCITLATLQCLLHSTTRPRESALAKRVSCFRISSFPRGFPCFFLGGFHGIFQAIFDLNLGLSVDIFDLDFDFQWSLMGSFSNSFLWWRIFDIYIYNCILGVQHFLNW